jgi:hypothetical protein
MAKTGQVSSAILIEWLNPECLSKPILPGPRNCQSSRAVLSLHPFQLQGPVQQGSANCASEMKAALAPVEAWTAEDAL